MAKTFKKQVDPAKKAAQREASKRYQKLVNLYLESDNEDSDTDNETIPYFRQNESPDD